MTLSRWERDEVYPIWPHQPAVIAYLGYDPFTNPAVGRPKGNETPGVSFLSSDPYADISRQLVEHRMELKKTRKQMAKDLWICVKTLWGWETKRHKPNALLRDRILRSGG